MYEQILKPLLFTLSPERAHQLSMNIFDIGLRIPVLKGLLSSRQDEGESLELMDLTFPNRIGLAAGFDKDGKYLRQMKALGFGFVEVGTVTPKAQPGNPLPRLFRLPEDRALINHMGFNNAGVHHLVRNLDSFEKGDMIIGGNIGKNKLTTNEDAVKDYLICLKALHRYVDYFVLNVSSPNTPGLRKLQEKDVLCRLLGAVTEQNAGFQEPRPILLKVSPDLSQRVLDELIEVASENYLSGLILCNTTISREGLKSGKKSVESCGNGGLSGAPLYGRSRELLHYVKRNCGEEFCLISVGGIESGEDASERIRSGADLLQVFTGMIYRGPSLIRKLRRSVL